MKTLLVCTSVSHGNTRRVAEAMAEVLDARVVAPEGVATAEAAGHDVVGFGSGVFAQRMHPHLLAFVRALPASSRRTPVRWCDSSTTALFSYSYGQVACSSE
ncbi:flavodoxin domain-containing protein [Streptomyces nojiriensis]|uniref:flavodoxin domain-containing protein n=1 Tax=Streptomyces nojiriensis TaxID=66374 RepID=UPI0036D75BC6